MVVVGAVKTLDDRNQNSVTQTPINLPTRMTQRNAQVRLYILEVARERWSPFYSYMYGPLHHIGLASSATSAAVMSVRPVSVPTVVILKRLSQWKGVCFL